jgi:hypothetical protein
VNIALNDASHLGLSKAVGLGLRLRSEKFVFFIRISCIKAGEFPFRILYLVIGFKNAFSATTGENSLKKVRIFYVLRLEKQIEN